MLRYAVSSLLLTANLFRETNEKLPDFGFHPGPLNAWWWMQCDPSTRWETPTSQHSHI